MSKGPIVAPTVSDNKLDLIKGLMNLLKEAGLVASSFDANELFDLDLKVIPSSVKTVIIELKPCAAAIKITEAKTNTYGSDRPYHQIGEIDQLI
ncbi:hypothetical protein PF010_g26398 [Phytophthora fragariae]|uniref:Uncharacterized protein n=1 Tax=Phytophthora fragariae TaxID=53985 RepID=A0A6A3EX47_9STRA|nr:hypothetical protein PF009_g12116 [Phytophthora fragariae]KAE9070140.1 hypothetical protein PF010_g26398 [Phytophthora fragariae]